MKPLVVLLLLQSLLILSKPQKSLASFSPIDNYLIVCGSTKNVTFQGRTFVPDSDHSSMVMKSGGSSATATSSSPSPSPVHRSARVFTSTGSYKFEIEQRGRHWVRLYFFPVSPGLASSTMSVVTDDFVLLENFTFFQGGLNASSQPQHLFKEYSVNVTADSLTLTFIPGNGSAAFVNAVEVVSIPDGIFPDQALDVNPSTPFSGLTKLAFETVYRLNMGGPLVTPENDTLGRTWENDERYLHVNSSAAAVNVTPSAIKYPATVTPEIAPNLIYASAETMGDANVSNSNFNVTWVFDVDPGFEYFLRVHFCDIVSKGLNTLVFNLYINEDSALGSFDMSAVTGDLEVPLYKDYVSNSSAGTRALTVSVGPDSAADVTNAILNGLEIMRISNEFGSLAGATSVERLLPSPPARRGGVGLIVGCAVGAMSAVLVAVGLVCFCAARRRRVKSRGDGNNDNNNNNNNNNQQQHHHPWLPLPLYGGSQTMTKMSTNSNKSATASCISLASSNFGRFFLFQEILDATGRFDESLLLGVGGFGRVYRGTLEDGTKVAVKRGNPRSEQGMAEFRTEIEMLSKLRHRHLVSLIGFCDERSEMILVYEYMANGPLRSHLYGAGLPPLTWKQRLEICIGAARGLHYLHTGAAQSIIHRDVKTTNILLDESFVAKVADFGLSKAGPALDQTHVSTAVKGSFGYLDPEYFRRQQLTEKSDVYSFGVVLMEVLCTRPALNPVLPRDQVNIAEWAMTWQRKGMLDQIMDLNLAGKVDPASLKKFGETAEKCLAEHGADRPSMGDVLWNLEYALQLQEASSAAAAAEPHDSSTNHITGIPIIGGPAIEPFDNSVSMIDRSRSDVDDEAEDAATSAVFSQLVNPRGR